jgi:hypothetical protein
MRYCLKSGRFVVIIAAALVLQDVAVAQNDGDRFLDRFTYNDEDIARSDGFFDYAPQNWKDIICDEESRLEECLGYTDKWLTGRGWKIQSNYCIWCPDGEGLCDRHHSSPIDLKRETGYEPGTNEFANECIGELKTGWRPPYSVIGQPASNSNASYLFVPLPDIHWMKYEDSTCSMQDLIDADAFTIERHGLRISQPITVFDDFANDNDGLVDGVRLDCRKDGIGSRFGRIDFSKGFSQWWHLSHIDIHLPSEHTQDGRRYDAEIQMKHFYSVTAEEAGVANEMGTVAVFMNAYDDAPPYRFLDKLICQWRRKEFEVREECGLPPVNSTYPGCFPLKRNLRQKCSETDNSNSNPVPNKHPHVRTAEDVILYNYQHSDNPSHKNLKILMDAANFGPAEEKDWDSWIAEQSKQMQDEDALYHKLKQMQYGGNHTDQLHEHFRRLYQGDELEWFNYWPMIGVRTEYYFRYSGTQTIPPCYGTKLDNTRAQTNNWRVMKDPIRIHPRQLQELQRLIGERIAPLGSEVNECMTDTAAKVTRDETTDAIIDVYAARPLQEWDPTAHFETFCECKDWESKWPEDRRWCVLLQDINERFYDKPYNFGW